MIDFHAVALVFSVYVIGMVSPGPNFVGIAHRAASSTTREALAMVGGTVLVNLFWSSCAILGVGIVVAVVAAAWYGFVAVVFATPRIAAHYRRGKAWIARLCGALIVALGVRQLLTR